MIDFDKNKYYYDDKKADRVVKFIERHIRHIKGELGGKLKELLSDQPDKLVVIQADRDLTLEKAVEIVDIAKVAGASKFMIATQPGSSL